MPTRANDYYKKIKHCLTGVALSLCAMVPVAQATTGLIPGESSLECTVTKEGSVVTLDFGNTTIKMDAVESGWSAINGMYRAFGRVEVTAGGYSGLQMAATQFSVGKEDCSVIGQLTAFPSVATNYLTKVADIGGAAPTITVGMASGADLEREASSTGWSLKVGLQEDRAYFWFEYLNQMEISMGEYKVKMDKYASKNKSRFIVDPFDPMVYIEGDFLGSKTDFENNSKQWFGGKGSNDSVAVGMSAKGFLGFTTQIPVPQSSALVDSSALEPYSFDGHVFLKGKVKMGEYPITLDGNVVVDFDADDSGVPFDTDHYNGYDEPSDGFAILKDTQMGFNGTFYAELGVDPLKFSVKLAKTSLVAKRPNKLLFAAQDVDTDAFTFDTGNTYIDKVVKAIVTPPSPNDPLDALVYGYIDITNSVPDFLLAIEAGDMDMNGLYVESIYGALSDHGLAFSGKVDTYDMGNFAVDGLITNSNCKLKVKAEDLHFAGYTVKNAKVNICSGLMEGIDALIDVSGDVYAAGQWVAMEGENVANVAASTLLQADDQALSLASGTIDNADMALDYTGMKVKNATAKYGSKAKNFALNTFSVNGAGDILNAVSGSASTHFDTGSFSITGGQSFIASASGQVSGDADYSLRVDNNDLKVGYGADIKVKACAKFKFAGLKTTKCDSVNVAASDDLDLGGCFKTPSKSVKLCAKLAGIKKCTSLSVPSKKVCLF